MIYHDQPTLFDNSIIVAVSSVADGTMSFRHGGSEEVKENRLAFLNEAGIDPLDTALLRVTFDDTTDFTRYRVLDDDFAGEGILEPGSNLAADALVATRPGKAIFLPLADCVGAIIYDPLSRVLMVSHLGRHSVEAYGGQRSIDYLKNEFGSTPAELMIWLSPAVGNESYPLHAFNGRSLHEVAVEQMVTAGASHRRIEVSHIDTAESPDYFSHSEFLAGNRPEDGRFAIVAMMVE